MKEKSPTASDTKVEVSRLDQSRELRELFLAQIALSSDRRDTVQQLCHALRYPSAPHKQVENPELFLAVLRSALDWIRLTLTRVPGFRRRT